MQHAPINDPARYRLQKLGMRNAPEVVRQVRVYDFRVAAKQQLLPGGLWLSYLFVLFYLAVAACDGNCRATWPPVQSPVCRVMTLGSPALARCVS